MEHQGLHALMYMSICCSNLQNNGLHSSTFSKYSTLLTAETLRMSDSNTQLLLVEGQRPSKGSSLYDLSWFLCPTSDNKSRALRNTAGINKCTPLYYGSFHSLFHYPNIPYYTTVVHLRFHYPNTTRLYYSSVHFLCHYPNIPQFTIVVHLLCHYPNIPHFTIVVSLLMPATQGDSSLTPKPRLSARPVRRHLGLRSSRRGEEQCNY